jgi:hypothetical protein
MLKTLPAASQVGLETSLREIDFKEARLYSTERISHVVSFKRHSFKEICVPECAEFYELALD